MKRFAELTEQEVLALAISNEEEEDNRIYRGFAEGAAPPASGASAAAGPRLPARPAVLGRYLPALQSHFLAANHPKSVTWIFQLQHPWSG